MWFDRQRNVVVYDRPTQAGLILQHVDGARQLHNGYVAAPVTLRNLQLLRHFGEDVPPPMERDYDWPSGPTVERPFNAQRSTANFLTVHPRALVLSDMGTGKTLSALWAADFAMGERRDCRTLIVAPLSTLTRVWADAIFEHFMGRRTAVVLYGDAKKREKLLAQDHDFYIVNHDGVGVGASYKRGKFELRGFAAALAERTDISLCIVDEISAYRDARTRRSRLLRLINQRRSYVWGLTGTPTPNGPVDAYGIARLINPNYGESFNSYRQRVQYKVSQFKWIYRESASEDAKRLLTPSIRFSLEDCVDLPPGVTQTREVEMSSEQRAAWKTLENELHLAVQGGHVSIANEAALRTKLIQVSCGQVYDANHRAHALDCKSRIAVLKEVIEEAGGKVIVFAPLTSVVSMLRVALKEYTRAVVTGDVGRRERDEIYRAFQSDRDPRVLIAHPDTMAHGLNLHAAATVIWYGPTDKTETYLQANRRIRRPGQTRAQTIVHLASNRIEREIYRRLAANESMQGLVLKMAREGL